MFISLVGPFGIGKTTIARFLADSCPNKYTAVFEDLSKNLFLEDVWSSGAPSSFEMQVNFITDVCEDLTSIELAEYTSPNFVFYDRSLLESAVIYPKYQYAKGLITKKQQVLLGNLYTAIKSSFPSPDLMIYCQAEPEVIFDRIQKRKRPHESGVTLKDVTSLCDAYTECLQYETVDTFCFDLNTEQTLDKIKDEIETILYKVY